MGCCDGRVVIVTGAGRGLGRAHALAFAAEGAHVLVNDYDTSREGFRVPANASAGADADVQADDAASAVVSEITESGGSAVANNADVADWDQAADMIGQAVSEWGRLDTLVCNAGFLRDRMLVNMSEQEWDAVVRVHLKGHFASARHAAAYWRSQHAATGNASPARIVNTTSGAGLMGSIGQGNYAAAKAAIALLTIQQAAEFGGYGVRVNAIAPAARTRMTAGIFYAAEPPAEAWDPVAPDNVSPLVVWLGSQACELTGRVFECEGGQLNVCDGWQHGPIVSVGKRKMTVQEAGDLAQRSAAQEQPPAPVYGMR